MDILLPAIATSILLCTIIPLCTRLGVRVVPCSNRSDEVDGHKKMKDGFQKQ